MEVGKKYQHVNNKCDTYLCLARTSRGIAVLENLGTGYVFNEPFSSSYTEYKEPRSKTIPVFLNEYATGLQVDTFFSTNSPRTIARKTITITEGEGM